ncbi:hypothetical protein LBMAG21_13420 [Armatimonadota bacterium]|nr:hypothetical protein LBMAG21_13420 [Armatimonadota bacterium]
MKSPWSLRDNPVSLAVTVVGLLVVLLAFGWLTVRIGSLWTRNYVRRQIQLGE